MPMTLRIWKEAIANLKTLLGYVRDVLGGRYKDYSAGKLLLAIAALIYVFSPVDVLPDVVPVLGWIDDATVLGWATKQLMNELSKYRRHRDAASFSPSAQ